MLLELLTKIAQIILIDIVLSGDNAVVIAMAAHKLPEHQRKQAILWGGGIAIFMRVVFTLIMAFLLMVPGVRFIGGIVLVWIACKLLLDEDDGHELNTTGKSKSTWAAIRMIFVADFVMSLDNMLAVAGAAGEKWWMIVMGLLVSIIIIMFFSSVIARLMNKYHWIVYVGAAILAFTAGEMIIGDRELAGYFARTHHVSLDRKWEEEFMVTRESLSDFRVRNLLPDELRDVVRLREVEFVGQMTEQQRDSLLALVGNHSDREAIDSMYERSRHRDVPDWVSNSLNWLKNWKVTDWIPGFVEPRVKNWVERRWPAAVWNGVQGRQFHFVAWIFDAVVVAFCLALPAWLKKRGGKPAETDATPNH